MRSSPPCAGRPQQLPCSTQAAAAPHAHLYPPDQGTASTAQGSALTPAYGEGVLGTASVTPWLLTGMRSGALRSLFGGQLRWAQPRARDRRKEPHRKGSRAARCVGFRGERGASGARPGRDSRLPLGGLRAVSALGHRVNLSAARSRGGRFPAASTC